MWMGMDILAMTTLSQLCSGDIDFTTAVRRSQTHSWSLIPRQDFHMLGGASVEVALQPTHGRLEPLRVRQSIDLSLSTAWL
jgi:hypothetical protein